MADEGAHLAVNGGVKVPVSAPSGATGFSTPEGAIERGRRAAIAAAPGAHS